MRYIVSCTNGRGKHVPSCGCRIGTNFFVSISDAYSARFTPVVGFILVSLCLPSFVGIDQLFESRRLGDSSLEVAGHYKLLRMRLSSAPLEVECFSPMVPFVV